MTAEIDQLPKIAARPVSERLNQECFCITLDRDGLCQALEREVGDPDFCATFIKSRPHLFSNAPVFLSESDTASASHGEVPSRKGYPGYMYSDLASIYERAGCIQGAKGTVTQLPILTMPAEDISHPIPDLTGYITEGQVVLNRALDHKGVFPPINVLPSLSRLMDQGIGKDYSHPDHPGLANQLFASYAKAVRVRVLASVVGRDGLTELDLRYLDFADQFESALIRQTGRRTLEDSMNAGWKVLRLLPQSELARLSDAQIAEYIAQEKA